jgi:hypothetical protein
MLRRILALVLLAMVLAGCSVQLRTAPAPVSACDDALASGRLVANAQTGLAFEDQAGGVMLVLWPFGYSASRGVGGIELRDAGGAVIAREGDFVTAGGGTGNDGLFAVCPASVKVVPPPG